MATGRYVITADVIVPAGTAATLAAGEPGTGAPAGPGNAATAGGDLPRRDAAAARHRWLAVRGAERGRCAAGLRAGAGRREPRRPGELMICTRMRPIARL